MLSNPFQYSPQSLVPQFPGLQAAGWPQMSPGLFGQPGAYNGTAQFGHDSGQAGFSQQFPFGFGQQSPFGGQTNPALQNPFATSPYLQSQNPYLQGQLWQSPAQQIVPVLGQLAQQIAVQSAVAQQIGIAVHQLAQQLAQQGLQGYPGGGFGGLSPQAQAWGTRPQTIQ